MVLNVESGLNGSAPLILRDSSKGPTGEKDELGAFQSQVVGIATRTDPERRNAVVGLQSGYLAPRNWHRAVHTNWDIFSVALTSDYEHGFAGFGVTPTSVKAPPGGIGKGGDDSNPFFNDWSPLQRSTRVSDYFDPRGRTALLAQGWKVLDDLNQQYTLAIPIGRFIGQPTPQPPRNTTPTPSGGPGAPQDDNAIAKTVKQITPFGTTILNFNASGKLISGIMKGVGGTAPVPGLKTPLPGQPGGPPLPPAIQFPLNAAGAGGTPAGMTSDQKIPAGSKAGAGYFWDGVRGGLTDTVFRLHAGGADDLGRGRDGTPSGIMGIRTDVHFEKNQNLHGCVQFDIVDISTYNPAGDGQHYKANMRPDASAANTTTDLMHESVEWRPWYTIPHFNNFVTIDGPPVCPARSNTTAAYTTGQGESFSLALTEPGGLSVDPTIIRSTARYAYFGATRDSATVRSLWMEQEDGPGSVWAQIPVVPFTAAVGTVPIVASGRAITWGVPTGATHNLLSTTHPDTLAASPVRGDLVVANSTPAWSRFAKGSQNQLLAMGANDPAWTTQNLLDATHADTLAASVVRGDLVVGNATPKWARLGLGSNGQVLTSNGTDAAWGSVASVSGLPKGYRCRLGYKNDTATGTTVTVNSGSCRDSQNAADMTLAGPVGVSFVNAGALGTDQKSAGTGTTHGTVVIDAISSDITVPLGKKAGLGSQAAFSNASTTVTGTGTRWAQPDGVNEVAIGDLIGNATAGWQRVSSITDDTHLVVNANFFANSTAAYTIIESPTIWPAANTADKKSIVNITANGLTVNVGTVVASSAVGVTLTVGVFPNGAGSDRLIGHYWLWLAAGGSGTTVYGSTQRTTPYGVSGYTTSTRLLGGCPIGVNAAGLMAFTATVLSDNLVRIQSEDNITLAALVTAGTATAFTAATNGWQFFSVFARQATVIVVGTDTTASATCFVRERLRGTNVVRPSQAACGAASTQAGGIIPVGIDGAQLIEYAASAATASFTISGVSYEENLC